MTYVDGFVLVVRKGKMAAYKKMAKDAGKTWKRFGALQYVEAVGEDLFPDMKGMRVPRFPQIARAKKGEQVVFSFIVYKNKAHRNTVNKKVMDFFNKKYTEKDMNKPMPFDMKRMAYGGFDAFVDL